MGYKHLHILFLIIFLFGSELFAADSKIDLKVDSLFQISSPEYRVTKTVWVKGEETRDLFETALNLNARGVYTEHPFQLPDSLQSLMSLAVKFSDELNELLPDDLPDVTSTFSISDDQLMNSYARIFRYEMIQNGVDVIIISSQDTTSTLYQIVSTTQEVGPGLL